MKIADKYTKNGGIEIENVAHLIECLKELPQDMSIGFSDDSWMLCVVNTTCDFAETNVQISEDW